MLRFPHVLHVVLNVATRYFLIGILTENWTVTDARIQTECIGESEMQQT
jgi:hypothetical protein